MRSSRGMEWFCVLSGFPEETLPRLRELKRGIEIQSEYEYTPLGQFRSFTYCTITWKELSTDTTAPIANISSVFNLIDDLGYKVMSSAGIGSDAKSGDYKFLVWTFQKEK